MSQPIEESLLQAIKQDDGKAFDALPEKAKHGTYRLGRFPVLSLMYLYKARRLISAYEESFLKISNYDTLREPAEISSRFAEAAGKCLRLYLSETVSPLEMLLILDKTKRLKQVCSYVKPTAAVKARLQSIYKIKYSLDLWFDGDNVFMDRRPLKSREKRSIIVISLCSALAVAAAVVIPVTVASFESPKDGEVTRLKQIDFASDNEYKLKKNITLPDGYFVEKVNCKIIGNGKKLVFGKGAAFGELNGSLSDLTIESGGTAVVDSVSDSATVEKVTVNVNAAATVTEGNAFFATTNYGVIDGVTVNVSGKLTATNSPVDSAEEFICGGIVQNNSYTVDDSTQKAYMAVVENCTVNYSQFTLSGSVGANAQFGGVAGVNYGYVRDCTVTGSISADTFDVGGLCAVNNGLVANSVNKADISQKSVSTEWNPIVSGVVISNTYVVENCENAGSVLSVSSCGQFEKDEAFEHIASAAGIAYLSRGTSTTSYIVDCKNSGKIESRAAYMNAYAAGVCISSSGGVERCKNSGGVSARADNGCDAYVGGINALSYGYVYKAENDGPVGATAGGAAFIGGISAHSCSQFLYCKSSGSVVASADSVIAGGIFGFSETDYYGNRGTAEYCISDGKIDIDALDVNTAFVGGIVGYVKVTRAVGGGGVTDSIFMGECVSNGPYTGNIIGVCDGNIYTSNSYISDNTERKNFDGNYYVQNSKTAFGAIRSGGAFNTGAADKGATPTTLDHIKSSAAYRYILSELAKQD